MSLLGGFGFGNQVKAKEIGRGLKNGEKVNISTNISPSSSLSHSSHGRHQSKNTSSRSTDTNATFDVNTQHGLLLRSMSRSILSTGDSDDEDGGGDWGGGLDDYQDSRIELKAAGHNLVCSMFIVHRSLFQYLSYSLHHYYL